MIDKIRTMIKHPRLGYNYNYWRAILACPWGEPLHYHHDGCPSCWLESQEGEA